MSGTRGGVGRIVAMGIGLAVALLLLAVGEARAGKYAVAQCGWFVGADADWADSTGGAKFRSDAFCVPAPGSDPFDGAHLKSFTRDGQGTVTGTRYARWRWTAPPTTGITEVSGTWWHTLHDGIEQRIGFGNAGGGFDPFLSAAGTDVTPRSFVHGVSPPQPALEDRLLCARGEDKWCSLDPGSWSGLRALTITLEDDTQPAALMSGDVLSGGWRRGGVDVIVGGNDAGAGVHYGETRVDGARVASTEYSCAKVSVGGQWMGTRMKPCPAADSATHTIVTNNFSDGPHTLVHCAEDFAGNGACTDTYTVRFDNSPPAHPKQPTVAGGEGWYRVDDFDLSWSNPDQGPASPIAGVSWRLLGPGGYDTGAQFAGGRDRTRLDNLAPPSPGTYSLQLWLRDEAGNESPPSAVTVPLRFDDVPPGVAFANGDDHDVPAQIRADLSDAHSGPASGTISYRRLNVSEWTELPTKLQAGDGGRARLVAATPPLDTGTYVFRAEALDTAGNHSATTLRADGTEMAIRKLPPPPVAPARALPGGGAAAAQAASGPRAKTRLFARLGWRRRRGDDVTVPFGRGAAVSGRLLDAAGRGLGGRRLRVVSRPSRGALGRTAVGTVATGPAGGFRLPLPAGTSRRVTVVYPGEEGLRAARRPGLQLRVRAGITLRAVPLELRTGEAVRLSGRVRSRGAALPRRGKLVAIQYREAATHRWRPVMVVRTDHGGRFHAHYRFRYVSGTASIRLRATALAEERWPYVPGSSRPVTVRVAG